MANNRLRTRLEMLTKKCLELQDELWTTGWSNLTCEATVVYLEALVGKLRKLVSEEIFHRHAICSLVAVSKKYDTATLQNVAENVSSDYGFKNWEWDEYYNSRIAKGASCRHPVTDEVKDSEDDGPYLFDVRPYMTPTFAPEEDR